MNNLITEKSIDMSFDMDISQGIILRECNSYLKENLLSDNLDSWNKFESWYKSRRNNRCVEICNTNFANLGYSYDSEKEFLAQFNNNVNSLSFFVFEEESIIKGVGSC